MAVLLVAGGMYASRAVQRGTTVPTGAMTAARESVAVPRQAVTPFSTPMAEGPIREGNLPATTSLPAAVSPKGGVSYTGALAQLLDSVTDAASAARAERLLVSYRSKVSTRGDSAAIELIAAKSALLTGGAVRGCGILKRIDPTALSGRLKRELLEALPNCEGT